MTNQELMIFFKEMSTELDEILESNFNYRDEYFDDWKNKIIPKVHGTYQVKTKRIDFINYETSLKLQTILRDMYIKYNIKKKKSKENLEREKLLKAREGNIDFEVELAKMITGDNVCFPYRSSFYLIDFFHSLGHSFTHNGEPRKEWVKDRLEELHINEIHNLLSYGLFKKKYYSKYVDKLNADTEEEVQGNMTEEMFVDTNDFLNKAKKEFENFIQDSIVANKPFDLSTKLK